MKHTILKLLLFINSCLLIAYIGMTTHADLQLNTRGVIPLFLSSLLLIDVIYVSSCNIRENKTISLFCGLSALESWYILLSASENFITDIIFFALSPIIWCVSIKFMLMFLFQNGGYKFQKPISFCLTGTCICTLIGVIISRKYFSCSMTYNLWQAGYALFLLWYIIEKESLLFLRQNGNVSFPRLW